MYIAILCISLVLTIIAYIRPKWDSILFKLEMSIMTCFLCLRYGQGTDYFQYERMYNQNMVGIDVNWLFHNEVHGELGYKILEGISKWAGFPFVVFFGVLSFLMMIWTYKGINRYSNFKTLSAALLVPTFYFSYYIGIVREGFALAAVLGVLLPLYVEKKYWKYALGVLLLCGIHKYAFILFLPVVVSVIQVKYEKKRIGIVLGIGFGCFLWIFLYMFNLKVNYISFSPSYGAILLRVILIYIINHLFLRSETHDSVNVRLYEFCVVGFCIYMATCSMAFISHRLSAYMKIAEVVLLPRLLRETAFANGKTMFKPMTIRWKQATFLLVLCMLLVEGIKNINSYIRQGEYHNGIYFYNFPYVTVFNQDDIYKYRDDALELLFDLE